ncbi:succinate dehydrogenase / fumarate reductase membrane anchor subunit [Aurantimicrobium minutum]|uniref:succinate dehydrogenase hydrophobic membrane anchor subunit n=1 Tax=Aurantimicrobium minutum TaxID=708131 RepID=UPI00247363B3|nr:succinate dehydrogenase hydrophobic membrane anchor subunit [Aurantimicrobium minutum]MDH6278719.1 succinate dehydrogenase / fumarate reductase membrane anchor subunit [Aurantimicrobium minutum]
MSTVDAPRSPYARTQRSGTNWEKWGWMYMRASGVVLVVLIFGHLFVNMVAGEGVRGIDFAFVAGKWASPFWQVWDLLMLWLALIHGANGMRTIINDYSSSVTLGKVLRGAVFLSAAALIILGTLVIFTFDPCPSVSPEQLGLLPSFCPPQ